uniref:Ycf21 n=1 Tax=Pterocladia lucida TaxID=31408 RepID=A0A6M3WVZ0_PTELU|nr:Ycf21 [Pterocladia lucida]
MIYIDNKHKFYKITNIDISNNLITSKIPLAWKLILTSDGSFTQNLNSITNRLIYAHIKEQSTLNYKNNKKILRKVWLEDQNNKKLTFAQSLWYINDYTNIYLNDKVPIGQFLLQSGIEIYKKIDEVYYGNSIYLEYFFDSQDPIWGRKYKIYHKNKILAIIQEFFPSRLENFLKKIENISERDKNYV